MADAHHLDFLDGPNALYAVDSMDAATPSFPDLHSDFPAYVKAVRAFADQRVADATAARPGPIPKGPESAFSLFDFAVASMLGSASERPGKPGACYSWELSAGWLDYTRLPVVLPLIAASLFTPGACAVAAMSFREAIVNGPARDSASFVRARDILMLAGNGSNECCALCLQGGQYWQSSPRGTIEAFNRGHVATVRHRAFVTNLRLMARDETRAQPIVTPPPWPHLTWPLTLHRGRPGITGPRPRLAAPTDDDDDDDDLG
ncbi:MAG TPA: hypothetical protein VFQ88_14095 [Nevskiaceae bacterium]|nr:hypothetical protein [Nevskiaceae bacterium]